MRCSVDIACVGMQVRENEETNNSEMYGVNDGVGGKNKR
jgi:hypothetical protein